MLRSSCLRLQVLRHGRRAISYTEIPSLQLYSHRAESESASSLEFPVTGTQPVATPSNLSHSHSGTHTHGDVHSAQLISSLSELFRSTASSGQKRKFSLGVDGTKARARELKYTKFIEELRFNSVAVIRCETEPTRSKAHPKRALFCCECDRVEFENRPREMLKHSHIHVNGSQTRRKISHCTLSDSQISSSPITPQTAPQTTPQTAESALPQPEDGSLVRSLADPDEASLVPFPVDFLQCLSFGPLQAVAPSNRTETAPPLMDTPSADVPMTAMTDFDDDETMTDTATLKPAPVVEEPFRCDPVLTVCGYIILCFMIVVCSSRLLVWCERQRASCGDRPSAQRVTEAFLANVISHAKGITNSSHFICPCRFWLQRRCLNANAKNTNQNNALRHRRQRRGLGSRLITLLNSAGFVRRVASRNLCADCFVCVE